jgi:hypothetical protein
MRCLQSGRAPAIAGSDAATEVHLDEIAEGRWLTKNLRGNDEFYRGV